MKRHMLKVAGWSIKLSPYVAILILMAFALRSELPMAFIDSSSPLDAILVIFRLETFIGITSVIGAFTCWYMFCKLLRIILSSICTGR